MTTTAAVAATDPILKREQKIRSKGDFVFFFSKLTKQKNESFTKNEIQSICKQRQTKHDKRKPTFLFENYRCRLLPLQNGVSVCVRTRTKILKNKFIIKKFRSKRATEKQPNNTRKFRRLAVTSVINNKCKRSEVDVKLKRLKSNFKQKKKKVF